MRKLWGIFFAFLCMLIPCMGVFAESYQENTQFDINVTYGYEDTVKIGREVSFLVSVHNLGEAFQGTVHLMTAGSEEDGYYSGSEILPGIPVFGPAAVRYYDNYGLEKPLELAQGEEGTVSFEFPYMSSEPYVKVVLENTDGEVLIEKIIRLTIQPTSAELLVGVLTDLPEQMEYMDGVHLTEYSNISTAAVLLNEKSLGKTSGSLDMLEALIVQNFDSTRLGKEQEEAIRQWVLKGGVLVLGADVVSERENEEPEEALGAIEEKSYGNGRILICSESLAGVQQENASMNTAKVDALFREIYTRQELGNLDSGSSYFGSEEYWNTRNRLNSIDRENIPGIGKYAVVLGIYVILAGPVMYLVLKRYRVRKYIWGCVGVLAVTFSALMFFMGSSTRFNAPFVNYVRTIHLTKGHADEAVEFGVRAPYNEPYHIYVNRDYTIMPVAENGYYSPREAEKPDFSRESVRLSYGEKENKLRIESSRAFSEKYFRAERSQKTEEDYGILGSLNYFDGRIEGTVQNRTGYDLTHTFLFFKGHLLYLKDFPAGSKKNLAEQTLYTFAPGYGYQMVQSVLGQKAGYEKAITEEFLDMNWKQRILSDYQEDMYGRENWNCRFVGFAEEDALELLKDPAYKQYGQTLVTADIELSGEKTMDGHTWKYDPFLTDTAQVLSGNYGEYENVYYSREAVLKYTVPAGLTEMELTFGEEKFFDTEYYKSFSGKIFMYNYDTGKYEKVPDDEPLEWNRMIHYISGNREMLIKYERKSAMDEKAEKLPMLILKGRSL